jgi:hypothetical protein
MNLWLARAKAAQFMQAVRAAAEFAGVETPAEYMEALRAAGESASADFHVLRRGFIPDESKRKTVRWGSVRRG